MAKPEIKHNPRVNAIFDDLDKYLDFCVTHGFKFDEADLYNTKSYIYRQYTKYLQGKSVRNMWELDMKAD
jgi:hypothetical protein